MIAFGLSILALPAMLLLLFVGCCFVSKKAPIDPPPFLPIRIHDQDKPHDER